MFQVSSFSYHRSISGFDSTASVGKRMVYFWGVSV